MGYLRFLIPFLLFFQVGDARGVHTRSIDGQLNLHTRSVKKTIRLGVPLELPCNILGDSYDPFLTPIFWKKVVGSEVLLINNGIVINTPFASTERYSIKYDSNRARTNVSVNLSIKGVTLADSGVYKCEVQNEKTVLGEVTHTVTVVAPVESLSLIGENSKPVQTTENGTKHQTFTFVEDTPSAVKCIANGGHPKPTLKIYREKTEITDEFIVNVTNSTSGSLGLQVTSYTVTLEKSDYVAALSSRGEHLRCVAKIRKLKQTKTALIEVKYGPRFECDPSPYSFIADVNVTLMCRIRANPPVTTASLRWVFNMQSGPNGSLESMVLKPDNELLNSYSSTAELDEDGEMVVKLVVRNITHDSFNTYRLEAANDINSSQHDLFIFEAFTSAEPTTVEQTTEKPTSKPPKDTILPQNDIEKPATPVNGADDMNRMVSSLMVLLSTMVLATTSSIL